MTSYRLNRFNSFFMGAAAVILLAVWRVFVRKHRKVYCSILQCHHCPCDTLGSLHGGVVSHRARVQRMFWDFDMQRGGALSPSVYPGPPAWSEWDFYGLGYEGVSK